MRPSSFWVAWVKTSLAIPDSGAHFTVVATLSEVRQWTHFQLQADLRIYQEYCTTYHHQLKFLAQHLHGDDKMKSKRRAIGRRLSADHREACQRLPVFTTRTKRGLFGSISGLIGSIAGGTALWKVHELSGRVDHLQSQEERLIQVSTIYDHRLQGLEHAVSNMTSNVKKLWTWAQLSQTERQWDEFAAAMAHDINRFRMRVDELAAVLESLDSGTVGYHLCSAKQLQTIWEAADKKVPRLTPAFDRPGDLVKLPASYSVNKDGFMRVTIHVPLTKSQELMKIMSPSVSPVKMVRESTSVMVEVVDTGVYLAKGEDSHREVTINDLTRCHKVGHHYLCDHQAVWWKKHDATCLGSLFHGKMKGVMKHCQLRILRDPEWAVAGKGEVWIYTANIRRYQQICTNSSETVEVEGFKHLKIPPGCELVGENLVVSTLQPEVSIGQDSFSTGRGLSREIEKSVKTENPELFKRAIDDLNEIHVGSSVKVHQILQHLKSEALALRNHQTHWGLLLIAAVSLATVAVITICTVSYTHLTLPTTPYV